MNLILVDDDRISIDILADIIRPQLDGIHEVLCAYDGNEAYDIIISAKPDIIITDIKMPGVNGIELIRKVRSIESYAPYVIIISSYSDFEYTREALKYNVFDYLLKPIDQDELIEKINTCVLSEQGHETQTSEDTFERVRTYLSDHLGDPVKLLDIADHFHYNAAYLGRLIKDRTGLNFNDYLLKLRIIRAQSLLVNTDDLIHVISTQVGFRDPEHFTKRFKMVNGVTPTVYRREHRAKS